MAEAGAGSAEGTEEEPRAAEGGGGGGRCVGGGCWRGGGWVPPPPERLWVPRCAVCVGRSRVGWGVPACLSARLSVRPPP